MNYSKKEELFNALSHGIGLVLAICGFFYLLLQSTYSTLNLISCVVYAGSLILLYSSSTMYHSIRNRNWKKRLKKIDHLSIYILIAGSYTPICLLTLNEIWGIGLLCLIWLLAAIGFVFKFSKWQKNEKLSLILYAIMGWLAIVAIKPIYDNLSALQFMLLILGGITYTVGIFFYAKEKIPYNHTIWHLFVLGGSAFHFGLVANLV